ncbi:dual specificity protein kinase FUZ7 [Paracoccidioides lutzii Pb01]|uniref:Dual specificity protein kinase FUZ7 n=1 Tax=Paracoccidioides lutzii (strain ATCC MYA-826 / Pb01) TaxID=502779 RepID=C1H5H9_PARBA|nr:dual specificity protein kinase FUZ7 [Paracoccidioides lutzii Pb01]EEH34973.1 dual specificity protein kinase FUZ7 [Paracoccidioides lutzii Pb01]
MGDSFKARTLKRKNVKGLALNAPAPKTGSNTSDGDAQVPGAIGNVESIRTDTLEIGLEFKLDLRSEDLVVLKELGAGNGGTVSKVMHVSTKVVMARKVIRVDAKENVRKQIVRELQVGHDCNSPYIVTFYGAFQNEARDIVLCMEYMDCGSLDRVSKDFGPVRVDVLGKIAESILGGLVYLYEVHRIMHRDIKPSNVLLNSRGNIKLCDFGVATETVNSIADTFVGTSTYMAPERIQGGAYSVRSDVWSVGLTIMELAVGRFPFDSTDSAAGDRASAGPMGILDLLQQIVHEPAPKLPKSDAFPPILDDFVAKCLLKKPEERPTPRELYDKDAFLQAAKRTPVNLREWAISMMEQHNRKSYLAPPAPKSINRDGSRDSMCHPRTAEPSPAPRFTPTSGEIPLNITREPLNSSGGLRVYSDPMSAMEPSPTVGFEHLSLDGTSQYHPDHHDLHKALNNHNNPHHPNGNGSANPASARQQYTKSYPSIDTSVPQHASPMSASATMTRAAIQSATLPSRVAPPPSGPLPAPPGSAGAAGWRSHSHRV